MPADKIDVQRLAREASSYADAQFPPNEAKPGAWRHIRDEHFARLVIEEAAKVCKARAGVGPYAESMGAHRILTSAADAIRDLKP